MRRQPGAEMHHTHRTACIFSVETSIGNNGAKCASAFARCGAFVQTRLLKHNKTRSKKNPANRDCLTRQTYMGRLPPSGPSDTLVARCRW